MRVKLQILAMVVAGGAVGSVARWWVAEVVENAGRSVGTYLMVVNVVGAFILGWFVASDTPTRRWTPGVSAFVATGILGSFTTFSGLTVEAMELARTQKTTEAVILMVASLLGGLAAAMVGRTVGQK